MANKTIREQARELRSQGNSMTEIASQLNVSKGSVSLWTRDIQLTEAQQDRMIQRQKINRGQIIGSQKNREKGARIRTQYQQEGREQARLMRPLHLAGCMLYWAEGAKARNVLAFVNSDTEMMQFFVRFLKQEMNIPGERMSMYIHCHSTDPVEIERVKTYWIQSLDLPQSSMRKVLHKQGSQIQRSILPNGVCRIQVYNSQLVQHIYGAIQEYTGLDKPEWLYMDKASKR